jgi:hypothetical protein
VKDVLVASTVTAPFCSSCRCLVSVVNVINLPRRFSKHLEVRVCVVVWTGKHMRSSSKTLKSSLKRIILHDVGPRYATKILLTLLDEKCITLMYKIL